jgi:cytidylate kinase
MAIVAITRQAGSGGEDIGKAIAEKLGYEYIGKNQLLKDMNKYGNKWTNWGKNLDEHCPTLWEHFDPSFAGFVSIMEDILLEYAMKDNVVIMGRGAYWLLRDIPHALRILIKAPIETRVKRISDREHVNMETAERLIEFSDHERECYIRTVYKRDWLNPDDYDMVFDTSQLSYEEIMDRIIKEIPKRDEKKTEESKRKLFQLALTAKVKAAIATDMRVFVPTLEVVSEEETIVIKGVVHNIKEHKIVEDIAREIAKDVKVRCELRYRG